MIIFSLRRVTLTHRDIVALPNPKSWSTQVSFETFKEKYFFWKIKIIQKKQNLILEIKNYNLNIKKGF